MRVIKNYVATDGLLHAQWQQESAEDAVWDAEWNKRHGPLPEARPFSSGGANATGNGRR